MPQGPKLFISFSSHDVNEFRKLCAFLEIQDAGVWDYSDEGQELAVGHDLRTSLKQKIDECEFFLALISPNSIDEQKRRTTHFEVRYAIDSGKANNNRLLPLLLHKPGDEWLTLYHELESVLYLTYTDSREDYFEDVIRRVCDWLGLSYTPSALRDPRVFFAKLFLEEIDGKHLKTDDFIELLRVMDGCARKLLADDWEGVKAKATLFLSLAEDLAPEAQLHYPLVIKGISELQLKQFEHAERTFLQATVNHDVESNPLLWLGFAGLGHTYFLQNRFEQSLAAFQKAVALQPDDKDLYFNHIGALLYAGGIVDDAVADDFALSKLTPAEQLKVRTLKAAVNYRNRNFDGVIKAFEGLSWDEFDEDSAIYYSLALQERGEDEFALDFLKAAANRIKSVDLFHRLANTYLSYGLMSSAISIFESVLLKINEPGEFARQILIEYAQVVKLFDAAESERFRVACERVVNFKSLPPPQTQADYFFTGFAYHLLHKAELARHYFDHSADFSPQYYDQLEPKIY